MLLSCAVLPHDDWGSVSDLLFPGGASDVPASLSSTLQFHKKCPDGVLFKFASKPSVAYSGKGYFL